MTPKPGFSERLCAWYEENHRALPWRETRDPYRIWVSEIMLQQTQVETVRGYYERFIEAWPTVMDLASAELSAVLKVWEGLGYYARCRNLVRAAKIVAGQHGGRFPETMEGMLALPGIGRSTAGAILTFGFGQRHPILDGNVRRVLSRLYDLCDDPRGSAAEQRLFAWSAELLAEAGDAYTHNQAVMELGARVCVPRAPECDACPVFTLCDARAAGTVAGRPVRRQRAPLPHFDIGAGVILRGGMALIQLRPSEGLLGGLWEFPGGKRQDSEALEETVRRECREELGVEVRVLAPLQVVRHAYSHFRITLHAYRCELVAGEPVPRAAEACRWVRLADLAGYAFPKANKVVLEALLSENLTTPRIARGEAPLSPSEGVA